MMRLQVTVELHGEIIEETVLEVTDGLRLGEHDEAVVAFPGLDVILSHDADDDVLVVRGHRLSVGDCLELGHGEVAVTLAPVAATRLRRAPPWKGDITLPVLLAAALLLSLTVQTAHDVLLANPDVSEGVARSVEALLLPEQLRTPDDQAPVVQPAWTRPDRFDTRPPVHYRD